MAVNLNKKNSDILAFLIVKIVQKLKRIYYINGIYIVSFLDNGELAIEITALDSKCFSNNDKKYNSLITSLKKEINELSSKTGFKINIKLVKSQDIEEDFLYDKKIYARDIKASTILYDPSKILQKYKDFYLQDSEVEDFDNLINLDRHIYKNVI